MEEELVVREGKKLALVVGCNYPKSQDREGILHGCHNDAMAMRKTLLERFGFKPNYITLMMDNYSANATMPTGRNIKKELYSMIGRARSGDVLFFFFPGHGMKSEDCNLESIIAADDNLITRVDFRHMVDRMPKGATFTIMADSCNSGDLIDKEPVQIGPPNSPGSSSSSSSPLRDDDESMLHDVEVVTSCGCRPRVITYECLLQRVSSQTGLNDPDIGVHILHLFGSDASLLFTLSPDRRPKPLKPDQGILLSGCRLDEFAEETNPNVAGEVYGVFTRAFHTIVAKIHGPALTNTKIVVTARKILQRQAKEHQHPCLYCSNRNAHAIFLGRP